MPKIEFLCGAPLSGKSTYARERNKRFSYSILSRDNIRVVINNGKYPKGYNRTLEEAVTKISDIRLSTLLIYRRDICIDNTNTNPKYIRQIINKLPPDYEWSIIFFDISLLKAYYRNIIRYILGREKKWIPIKVIKKFIREYKSFKRSYEDGLIEF